MIIHIFITEIITFVTLITKDIKNLEFVKGEICVTGSKSIHTWLFITSYYDATNTTTAQAIAICLLLVCLHYKQQNNNNNAEYLGHLSSLHVQHSKRDYE